MVCYWIALAFFEVGAVNGKEVWECGRFKISRLSTKLRYSLDEIHI